jgi:hypothetical protein
MLDEKINTSVQKTSLDRRHFEYSPVGSLLRAWSFMVKNNRLKILSKSSLSIRNYLVRITDRASCTRKKPVLFALLSVT